MSAGDVGASTDGAGVRLAELVAALSLATDLGLGQPQEHVLRQTVIASRLARLAGFDDEQLVHVYYTSLLAWVGCVSDSYEMAKWFGDDLRVREASYHVDKAGPRFTTFMLGQVGAGAPPLRRITVLGRFLVGGGSREAASSMLTHCQTAGLLAERLGFGEVAAILGQAFERWDGKGQPGARRGEAIDPVMRIVQVADDSEPAARVGGPAAAVDLLRSRRGTEFDPSLVDLAGTHADEVFGGLDDLVAWDAVVGAVAGLDEALSEEQLDDVLVAFADYADLKSPLWLGHSRGVEVLASGAAERLGLTERERSLTSRAALVHDLGALGVSAGIWDKEGPLTEAERERIRTHPYLTERVLARPPVLAEIGAVAGLHHERLDGSGYPGGLRGDALPVTAQIVATADLLEVLGEDRPHRAALAPDVRVERLRDEVRAGRLDGEVVNAVLGASGRRVRRRPDLPAGLTPREAGVLQLLVLGWPNKKIAQELGISPRTVGSHIEHIYTKIGVSTRGAASLYALRHHLVRDPSG